MAASSKKEKASTCGKTAAAMEEFTQQYPDWVHLLDQYLEQPEADISDEMTPTAKALAELLAKACDEIKDGTIEESDFYELFPQKFHSAIQKLAEPYLRTFHAFVPLRAVYEDSPARAESLIDQIWQQYVIRFNPYRKIERPNAMTDEDMSELENVLDAFAEYCGIRMLHYDAIIQRIRQEANLPDGLCSYIARKIDRDYQELRLNFIVSQLERLSRREEPANK